MRKTYDKALEAAARLFRLKGFACTTVRDIAKAAGMLPGSLHYRYATKEEILLALMERGIAQATEAIRSAMELSTDPLERVRLALRAHLRLLLSGDDAVYVLLNEWQSLNGTARQAMVQLRDRYEALWDEILREVMATGRLDPKADLKLIRLFGFGAINWVAEWYKPSGTYSPEEIADAFWAFMSHGVLTDVHKLKEKLAFV